MEKKNNELKEKDASLREFYDIISRRNMETSSGAELLTTEADKMQDGEGQSSQEEQQSSATEETQSSEEQPPADNGGQTE